MIHFNPELHELIYEDKAMVEFYEVDNNVVTIYQNDKFNPHDSGFVCIEIKDLKKILQDIGELGQVGK